SAGTGGGTAGTQAAATVTSGSGGAAGTVLSPQKTSVRGVTIAAQAPAAAANPATTATTAGPAASTVAAPPASAPSLNHAPAAPEQSATTVHDHEVRVAVLSGASDPDGDAVSVVSVS